MIISDTFANVVLVVVDDVAGWCEKVGTGQAGKLGKEGRKELSPKYHIYQFYNKLSSSYPPAQL